MTSIDLCVRGRVVYVLVNLSLFLLFRYKTRADFASDARLVFNNCMIFNEDESDVGKAGHTMRKFFESRWKEVLMSSTSPTKDDDDS